MAAAAFYIDNDVSLRLVPRLREQGHSVITTAERGLAEAKDPIQLLTAALDGRILLTHNQKDFILLHEAWHCWAAPWGLPVQPTHGGIIVIPQPLPADIVNVIEQFLAAGHPIQNRLFRWRSSDGWSQWQLGATWVSLTRT